MVFGFLRRKKRPPAPSDPLATLDGLLEDLQRQAAAVRRSAATLLALRGQLTREEEAQRQRLGQLRDRLTEAQVSGDLPAQTVLERDEARAQRVLAATEEAQARAITDSELLLEAAAELSRQTEELEAERSAAQVRLTAGLAVSETLRQRSAQVSRLLKLDAVRDEVERAHALAEIYREDAAERVGRKK